MRSATSGTNEVRRADRIARHGRTKVIRQPPSVTFDRCENAWHDEQGWRVVRYDTWVAKVFQAVEQAGRGNLGPGPGLAAIGAVLGFDGLTRDDFVARTGVAAALMTAMYDLEAIGVADFQNVDYGNSLTANGRDVAAAGLATVWPEIFDLPASADERTFLARLYTASLREGEGWADLEFVDADPIYAECGFPVTEYADTMARFQFYGDLERKGLVRAEHHTTSSPNTYRPTYLSAVLATEPDPRHGGARAGLTDWSIPTPGFELVEEGLSDLKVKLDGALRDADLSDVGLRCRRLLVAVMQVVYRPEMVPADVAVPSPQDADGMLGHYLAARLPGKDNEEYRKFLRGAWALASARVHADRTGRASAVAAAQGTLSFIRAIQAIERTSKRSDG
jgi:hypothetical protein